MRFSSIILANFFTFFIIFRHFFQQILHFSSHIFDFDEDIYGKYIHVDFVARLRSEQEFDEIRDLVEQMHCDAANAKVVLAT